MHQLLSPKMTMEFVPTREFEVKQFFTSCCLTTGTSQSFTSTYIGSRFRLRWLPRWGAALKFFDPDTADEASSLLGRITQPGAFLEDIVSLLGTLPGFLQPSCRKARYYATIVHKGKMRAWNRIKEQVKAGNAPESFGKNLAMCDYGA